MKSSAKLIVLVAVSLFLTMGLLLALSSLAQADTITVANHNDRGEGSLRQALLRANVSSQSIIANLHRHSPGKVGYFPDSTTTQT